MDEHIATEIAYRNGYDAGEQAILDRLKTGIESFLTDDEVDVTIAEGEVFVPIGALRKIVDLEVK